MPIIQNPPFRFAILGLQLVDSASTEYLEASGT
jgi:hypothetical protein